MYLKMMQLSPMCWREDAVNIYIGNLSLETTEDELRREFTEFGEVISVTIMNDKYIERTAEGLRICRDAFKI